MTYLILYFTLIFSGTYTDIANIGEKNISRVVKADIEKTSFEISARDCEAGGLPSACCSYWDVKAETETVYLFHVVPIQFVNWECNTGGEVKCIGCSS